MRKPKKVFKQSIEPRFVTAYLYFALGIIAGSFAGNSFNAWTATGCILLIIPMIYLVLKDINDYYFGDYC